MGAKKYYWLKLKNDFFTNKKIKKLRKIAGGDTYTIIYLKMQLLSITNEGKLYFENIEDSFAEELALDLDEDVENVKITLMFLIKNGLLVEINQEEFLLPETLECIGSETSKAELMRKKREREKILKLNGNNVTELLPSVTKSYTEKEIDKDKELDIDKSKEKKYFENENINSIFIEFIEVRKKLKAVNSDRAINTLINKLNKYSDDVKYKMIENSIVNSWKDVYELKEQKNNYNKVVRKEIVPDWLNKEVQEETATEDEIAKLNKRLERNKEGDNWKEEAKELQQQLSEVYGK